MIEFIIVAPVLSFVILALLFLRHEIDYTRDSTPLFRESMWSRVPPGKENNDYGDEQISDGASFGSIRNQVSQAPYTSGNFDSRALLLYDTTPYLRLGLETENYHLPENSDMEQDKMEKLNNPWTNIVINMGTFFNRSGVSNDVNTNALQKEWFWAERFPMIVDPWQRNILWKGGQAQKIDMNKDIEIMSDPVTFSAMQSLNRMIYGGYNSQTFQKYVQYSGRGNLPHIHKADLSDQDARQNALVEVSGQNQFRDIIK